MIEIKDTKYTDKDFEKAKSLLNWNKFFLGCLGLWPKFNKLIFYAHYYAYSWHYYKDILALFISFSSHNLMRVIGTGMECISLTVLEVRLWMFKNYHEDFRTILNKFIKDYSIENYKTDEEKKIFFYYNRKARKFILVVTVALYCTGAIYITQPLMRQLSKFCKYINNLQNELSY